MASDLLTSGQTITGTGAATATATLAASLGYRGYVMAASVEVTAGAATTTLCRLELRDAGVAKFSTTFPLTTAAAGGLISFPAFLPITVANSALTIVATTTGATTTNVYGIVTYGP